MTKKKLLSLALALALTLSLAACGGGQADPEPAGTQEPAEPQEDTQAPEDAQAGEPDAQDTAAPAQVPEPEPEPEPEPLPEGPPTYTFENGVLTCSGGGEVLAKEDTGWIKVVQNATFSTSSSEAKAAVEKVVVERGITSLGADAFMDTRNLKEVSLPDTLTRIEGHAFSGSGLVSVAIPDSVTEIGFKAFVSCKDLTSVEIPNGVTKIGDYAFSGTGLTELSLPDSLTELGDSIIDNTQITRIEIPAGVEELSHSFGFCRALTEIILHNDIPLEQIERVLSPSMRTARDNGIPLTVYAPGGGGVEGWMNKQIAEDFPNCKFVAND